MKRGAVSCFSPELRRRPKRFFPLRCGVERTHSPHPRFSVTRGFKMPHGSLLLSSLRLPSLSEQPQLWADVACVPACRQLSLSAPPAPHPTPPPPTPAFVEPSFLFRSPCSCIDTVYRDHSRALVWKAPSYIFLPPGLTWSPGTRLVLSPLALVATLHCPLRRPPPSDDMPTAVSSL